MNKNKTLRLAQFSLLLAIEAIVCFTPFLGSLPAIGPIVATLSMIPVAITAILLGTGAGSLMGFFFGLFSFIVWTFTPPNPALAFLYTPFYSMGDVGGNVFSLIICFVPRILVGTVSALVYKLMSKNIDAKGKPPVASYMSAGALGSLVNTIGVLGGTYLFFAEPVASAMGIGRELVITVIGGIVLTSGIPEAIVCAVCCAAVCAPVMKIISKKSAQTPQ